MDQIFIRRLRAPPIDWKYITTLSLLPRLFSIPQAYAAQVSPIDSSASHILWDRIISIESIGREHVYDIEVEGTHNFVGNGIVAHNTYTQVAGPMPLDASVVRRAEVRAAQTTIEGGDPAPRFYPDGQSLRLSFGNATVDVTVLGNEVIVTEAGRMGPKPSREIRGALNQALLIGRAGGEMKPDLEIGDVSVSRPHVQIMWDGEWIQVSNLSKKNPLTVEVLEPPSQSRVDRSALPQPLPVVSTPPAERDGPIPPGGKELLDDLLRNEKGISAERIENALRFLANPPREGEAFELDRSADEFVQRTLGKENLKNKDMLAWLLKAVRPYRLEAEEAGRATELGQIEFQVMGLEIEYDKILPLLEEEELTALSRVVYGIVNRLKDIRQSAEPELQVQAVLLLRRAQSFYEKILNLLRFWGGGSFSGQEQNLIALASRQEQAPETEHQMIADGGVQTITPQIARAYLRRLETEGVEGLKAYFEDLISNIGPLGFNWGIDIGEIKGEYNTAADHLFRPETTQAIRRLASRVRPGDAVIPVDDLESPVKFSFRVLKLEKGKVFYRPLAGGTAILEIARDELEEAIFNGYMQIVDTAPRAGPEPHRRAEMRSTQPALSAASSPRDGKRAAKLRQGKRNFELYLPSAEEIVRRIRDTASVEDTIQSLKDEGRKAIEADVHERLANKLYGILEAGARDHVSVKDFTAWLMSREFGEAAQQPLSDILESIDIQAFVSRVREAVIGEAAEAVIEVDRKLIESAEALDDARLSAFEASLAAPIKSLKETFTLVIDDPETAVSREALIEFRHLIDRLEILHLRTQHLKRSDWSDFPNITVTLLKSDREAQTVEAVIQRGADGPLAFLSSRSLIPPALLKNLNALSAAIHRIPSRRLQKLAYKASFVLLRKLAEAPDDKREKALAGTESLRAFMEREDVGLGFMANGFSVHDGTVSLFAEGLMSDIASMEQMTRAA